MQAIGVYFLANDRVRDLTIAFLNSFRTHNPCIPLYLIPFDDQITEIARLSNQYCFSIYDNRQILAACDAISTEFHGKPNGCYRKLVAWAGPLDRFIYIDVDTVVLMPLDFAFTWLNRFDFITGHSDIPDIRKWTWKDSIFSTHALDHHQISYAANMGFITSKREIFSWEHIEDSARSAIELKEHMELYWCHDQPFMNFLAVTSGINYTSFHSLARQCPEAGLPFEYRIAAEGSGFCYDYSGRDVSGKQCVFIVHWAGQWQRYEKHLTLWRILTAIGIRVPKPVITRGLRQKALWKYYRYLHLGCFRHFFCLFNV
jgi:hypothetical protein